MKTDRELLELAAKAYGIYVARDESGNPTNLFCDAPNASAYEWNTIESDGDRYRLAEKLGMNIDFRVQVVLAKNVVIAWPRDEPTAARAITRAAAAIGEAM